MCDFELSRDKKYMKADYILSIQQTKVERENAKIKIIRSKYTDTNGREEIREF